MKSNADELSVVQRKENKFSLQAGLRVRASAAKGHVLGTCKNSGAWAEGTRASLFCSNSRLRNASAAIKFGYSFKFQIYVTKVFTPTSVQLKTAVGSGGAPRTALTERNRRERTLYNALRQPSLSRHGYDSDAKENIFEMTRRKSRLK
ncbi:hypothetical protein EVAR_39145_1 [Eumeta japonica]|uniref:Uncharacterized protein n=1 Tax=Eumeta variegata TaxID=151549 RepID=A0A4C1X7N3_EUMVA|nr:hypothetical protein EVAR_39145_1 [Eumeta japonica]